MLEDADVGGGSKLDPREHGGNSLQFVKPAMPSSLA
jgi:hypothetical protein